MAIGYACLHIGSEKTKFSSIRLKSAEPERIRSVIAGNLKALESVIEYNNDNDIRLFRICSEIIPFGSHPINTVEWWKEFEDELANIGSKIREYKMRVSMHPGQYTVLNSPVVDIYEKSVDDLEYHCRFLDSLGCDSTSKMTLHIGGVYCDKKTAVMRFIRRYKELSDNIKRRLIIENDDKSYNAQDVLSISERTGIPVVFDSFHNELNSVDSKHSTYDWIDICRNTWKSKDGLQKIHYSQPNINGVHGAHSQHIISKDFLNFYEGLHTKNIDIMLEVKDKNLSAMKCIMLTKRDLNFEELEKEWERYKYFVMSRSLSIYNRIEKQLEDRAKADASAFYSYIDDVLLADINKDAEVNAAQSVWGCVGKKASEAETERFYRLLNEYQNRDKKVELLKNFLYRMAKRPNNTYLLNSYYFYI